jgi:nitrate/nitrite transporter NarK
MACMNAATVVGPANFRSRFLRSFDKATAAAAGIAMISSLANLGAAVSPSLTGAVTAAIGNPANGMCMVIAWYLVAGAIMLAVLKPAKSG